MKEIEEILKSKGITPTPVRMLVYGGLSNSPSPQSLADLEYALESVDKSTISRTLALFREHHLLHSFNDGSGSVKYELCSCSDNESHDGFHVHFRCENCGETTCFKTISIPPVSLPDGYVAHESNYVIKGICRKCRK